MLFDNLDIEFPELAGVIDSLRLGNPRLNEIFSDYELLLDDHRQLSGSSGSSTSSRLLDVEETLSALLEEIAKNLGVERRSL